MRKQLLAVFAGVIVASVVAVGQSDEIGSEEDYDAAMKEVRTTFGALNSAMDARDGDSVLSGTAKLAGLFEQVEAFWASRDVPAAAAIATEAAEAANAIRAALKAQAFQEIAPTRDALAATCQTCHNEYRERVDGNTRIKPVVL
jgi:cytochrome c556